MYGYNSRPKWFSWGNSIRHLRKKNANSTLTLPQKIQDEGIFPNSIYEASNTLILIPDKKKTKNKKQETNTYHEHILANCIQNIQRIIHHS